MKKIWTLFALLAVFSCGGNSADPTPDPTPVDPTPSVIATPSFALGADISWASEMSASGRKFKKADGSEAALPEVLKEAGVNAVRLRVWVDPYKGWSGKADVLSMAKQVKAAGLALMVDFHYSDFFADPGRQKMPAAWASDASDLSKLCSRVADHTKEVLQALKDAGIQVHWIQIGNETRNGMLWPAGQLWSSSGDIPDGRQHFAKLYNAGYDAAKAVYPDALVMPHVDNAYADNAWWFDQIQKAGGKFDAIALSHYPQAGTEFTPAQYNEKALASIKALNSQFNLPVFVAEVGVKQKQSDAASVLSAFMTEVRKISGCKGVFYWEPEVDGSWKPELYGLPAELSKYTGTTQSSAWGAYDMGAFTSAGQPSAVFSAFVQ